MLYLHVGIITCGIYGGCSRHPQSCTGRETPSSTTTSSGCSLWWTTSSGRTRRWRLFSTFRAPSHGTRTGPTATTKASSRSRFALRLHRVVRVVCVVCVVCCVHVLMTDWVRVSCVSCVSCVVCRVRVHVFMADWVIIWQRVQEKWKVVATVETPYTVLLPMQKSAVLFLCMPTCHIYTLFIQHVVQDDEH
jgi:hypothetical protein